MWKEGGGGRQRERGRKEGREKGDRGEKEGRMEGGRERGWKSKQTMEHLPQFHLNRSCRPTRSPFAKSLAINFSASDMRALVADGLSHSLSGLSSKPRRNSIRLPLIAWGGEREGGVGGREGGREGGEKGGGGREEGRRREVEYQKSSLRAMGGNSLPELPVQGC